MKNARRKRLVWMGGAAAAVGLAAALAAGWTGIRTTPAVSPAVRQPARARHVATPPPVRAEAATGQAAATSPATTRKEEGRDKAAARLLRLSDRLVRARHEIMLLEQRLRAAEIAARMAKADADLAKFRALREMFKKDPARALGEKPSPSAARFAEVKYGPPGFPPLSWGGEGGGAPRVKAVQVSAGGATALVETGGKVFLVKEGHQLRGYKVARITPDGVEFMAGKRKVFSPLAAAAGPAPEVRAAPRKPPFVTPPPGAFAGRKRP